jgi:hypothetical protein
MIGESKYAPLAKYLAATSAPHVAMSFAELDELLTGGLPESAYRYRTWWTSNTDGTAQSRYGWTGAGYRVLCVDLANRFVVFGQVR